MSLLLCGENPGQKPGLSFSMPEEERDGSFDSDEEYPWDCDLTAPGEADVHDLVSEDTETDLD